MDSVTYTVQMVSIRSYLLKAAYLKWFLVQKWWTDHHKDRGGVRASDCPGQLVSQLVFASFDDLLQQRKTSVPVIVKN